MPGLLKKAEKNGEWAEKQTGSSRSNHLYHIKKEARKIREAHAAGRITAEEAARKLRKLHSSSRSHFFQTSWGKVSA